MKTDPQNSDYVVEFSASRNYKPWRAEDEDVDKEKKKRDAEKMGNAMKALENRALDSEREMDILATLDDIKSIKSRHATVSVNFMLRHCRAQLLKTRRHQNNMMKHLLD